MWGARDGRLWFSTRAGAIVVDPRLVRAKAVPAVIAEQVLADHHAVDTTRPPVLQPGTFDVEIHYTAPSFTAPDKLRFRYRLEGFDPRWVEAGDRRVAYYTNLPPGRFRFLLTAANEDGAWNPVAARFPLRLLPRYYQTAWFRALMAALTLLALYGLYRLRVSRVEVRAAVAEERNRLAREIHDTIAQDLAGILMQARAGQRVDGGKPADTAGGRLARIAALAERGLEEARRSLRALRPQALDGRDLAAALAEAGRLFAAGPPPHIEVRSRGGDRPLPPIVESELLRIGGEAMTNAVKHGGARHIEVDLDVGRREAVLAVRDDGRGFDPAATHGREVRGDGGDDGDSVPGSGLGLVGMREHAARLGGQLEVSSAPGEGTRVEVRVPLRTARR